MNKNVFTNGFTLIELMIAIAIVGILLSLALPAYQDYAVRAKIAEALNLASAMKIMISEYYVSEGELPETAADAGIDTSVTSGYVSGIAYERVAADKQKKTSAEGRLKITLSQDIGGEAGDKVLLLKAAPATDVLTWECGTDDDKDQRLASKYLPAQCR